MSEKGFELRVNPHGQYDIVDWVESKEKDAICIYNDLGNYYFSSAKALCGRLNELHEKNKELKVTTGEMEDYLARMEEENKELKKENEQLKSEINMLKITIGRNESYIKRLTEQGEWRK